MAGNCRKKAVFDLFLDAALKTVACIGGTIRSRGRTMMEHNRWLFDPGEKGSYVKSRGEKLPRTQKKSKNADKKRKTSKCSS